MKNKVMSNNLAKQPLDNRVSIDNKNINEYKNLVYETLRNPRTSGTDIINIIYEIANSPLSTKLKDVMQACKDSFLKYINRATLTFAEINVKLLNSKIDKEGQPLINYFTEEELSELESIINDKRFSKQNPYEL